MTNENVKYDHRRRAVLLLCRISAVFIFVFGFTVCIGAVHAGAAKAGSTFHGAVMAADEDIPLGGIKISVYGSDQVYSKNGVNVYTHTSADNVVTDDDGLFEFRRPSERVLLKVRLSTLPEGTGISYETLFLSDKNSYDHLYLSEIADVSILSNADNTGYDVILLDDEGNRIFADFTATETFYAETDDITYDNIERTPVYRHVKVTAGNVIRTANLLHDISHMTIPGKLEFLYSNGIIDDTRRDGIEEIYTAVTTYPLDERPHYIDERTVTAGNFMLHYENGLEHWESYRNVINRIVSVFFDTYGFQEPYHEVISASGERDPYYHIYIVDRSALNNQNPGEANDIIGKTKAADYTDITLGSYILMSSLDDMTRFEKTLSHEIFHGIMYKHMGKKPATWFAEAMCDYASLLCLNETCTPLTGHVKNYLASTEFSFNDRDSYKDRHYGVMLLPLYIHNKMGGVQTIKNIIDAYANCKNAYTAIVNGLKATNSKYTFTKAFTGMANYNAFDAFYKTPEDGNKLKFGYSADRTYCYSSDTYNAFLFPQTTLSANGVRYYEFDAATKDKNTLDITIMTHSGYKFAAYNVIKNGKKFSIPVQTEASQFMTFEIENFSKSDIKKAVLVAANVSVNNAKETKYTVSATIG